MSMSETFDKSQMSETIDVPAGCYDYVLLSTGAAELTWDCLELTMGRTKGSSWLFRSGVMCVCELGRDWLLIQFSTGAAYDASADAVNHVTAA